MRHRHLKMFFLIASILSTFADSETSSSNWDSDSRNWERIQTVLPSSETFYVPTAQPRLFTDVRHDEEFTGNDHHSVGDFSEYSANLDVPGRYKRQHVETQIGPDSNNDAWTQVTSIGNEFVRNKRFNSGEETINSFDNSSDLQRKDSSNLQIQNNSNSPQESQDFNGERTFLSTNPSEKSDKPEDATAVLSGIYTECLMTLSFTCLQKKIIVLIEKLNKIQKFNLIGDYLTVVRNNKYATFKPSREDYDVSQNVIGRGRETFGQARESFGQARETSELKTMIDESLDNYFDTHVIRLKVPSVFQRVANGTNDEAEETHIDFDLGDKSEGRKKKKGGGQKKMMAMLGMMACYKLSMMGPMLMMLIGLKALKALLMATVALTISKLMLLKKLKGGGGHGHSSGYTDASSASGAGWDRSLEAQNLAYNSYKPEETTFEDSLIPVVQHVLSPIHATLNQQILNSNL